MTKTKLPPPQTRKAFPPPQRLGGPQAGTVPAVALAQAAGTITAFAGTPVGLFRATGMAGEGLAGWARLAAAPLGIVSLAVSPGFAEDRTVAAGTNGGIFVSRDGGDSWQPATMPMSGAVVVALAFSPSYARDGLLLAGTLEDGVFYSGDRGATWQRKSFGLLDAAVYALGFSPRFEHDETMLAGTESTVYHSYNGARAWKALPFPEDAAPALSLALSPGFATDGTLYAGTETHGLYRSIDRGQNWQPLSLPAVCINVLHVSAASGELLAGTDSGVYASGDQGDTWRQLLPEANVISLATCAGLALAGVVDRGAWLSRDERDWQPVADLSARSLLGLALSPLFERDHTAFLFGPQEAAWRTSDGGTHWTSLDEDELSTGLRDLALSPDFGRDRLAVAASPAGVLLATGVGDHWERVLDRPAARVAFSSDGRLLAAALEPGGLAASTDRGRTWQPVPGPWAGQLIALAVDNTQQFHVAVLEGVGETLSIWQGTAGQFEKVLSQPAGANPLVALYLPSEPAPDRPWYAGLGNEVWKLSARRGRAPSAATVFAPAEHGDQLLALTGAHTPAGPLLLAATGRQVFKSLDAKEWMLAYDFGQDRVLSLALSPTYAQDKTICALLLGGTLARAVVK